MRSKFTYTCHLRNMFSRRVGNFVVCFLLRLFLFVPILLYISLHINSHFNFFFVKRHLSVSSRLFKKPLFCHCIIFATVLSVRLFLRSEKRKDFFWLNGTQLTLYVFLLYCRSRQMRMNNGRINNSLLCVPSHCFSMLQYSFSAFPRDNSMWLTHKSNNNNENRRRRSTVIRNCPLNSFLFLLRIVKSHSYKFYNHYDYIYRKSSRFFWVPLPIDLFTCTILRRVWITPYCVRTAMIVSLSLIWFQFKSHLFRIVSCAIDFICDS